MSIGAQCVKKSDITIFTKFTGCHHKDGECVHIADIPLIEGENNGKMV
jgi:hypothetical protein